MSVKTKLMHAFEESEGEFISGEQIARTLGISRNAVWKTINRLKKEGCPIEAVRSRGYRIADTDIITTDGILGFLDCPFKDIRLFDELDSTNNLAKELARGGTENAVIIAQRQSAGKGRMGRSFFSPDGGIYMSVILRPKLSLEIAQLLTSCTAVAVAEAIDGLYGGNAQIKWVNDIFVNGRKLCGILTEASMSFEAGQLEYAVIGIGINVHSIKKNLPEELSGIVTSLEDEYSVKIRRSRLIAEVLNSLAANLGNIENRDFLSAYRSRSYVIGKSVIVMHANGEREAKAVGIDELAGLIVEYENGETEALKSGEVRIKCKQS